MSHFSRIQTKIHNREHLVQALRKMGYSAQVGHHQVRGHGGQTTSAEILVPLSNTNYNLGFVKQGEYYELVADWYGISGVDSGRLLQQLQAEIGRIEAKIKQEYAYQTTVKSLQEKGFDLVEETRENGEIYIQLQRLV